MNQQHILPAQSYLFFRLFSAPKIFPPTFPPTSPLLSSHVPPPSTSHVPPTSHSITEMTVERNGSQAGAIGMGVECEREQSESNAELLSV